VGKSAIGTGLAEALGCRFFDLDVEIERFFNTPIARLRARFLTPYSFRVEASRALREEVLARADSLDAVIALPPSGLIDSYWRIPKRTKDAIIIVLEDEPENILARITFYDDNSRPIQKTLNLQEIRGDIACFLALINGPT
jgi:shikimate kinase